MWNNAKKDVKFMEEYIQPKPGKREYHEKGRPGTYEVICDCSIYRDQPGTQSHIQC